MAMTAADMKTQIIAKLQALGGTMDLSKEVFGTGSGITAEDVIEAFCQGIIDGIVNKADISTTSGAPDSEHTGKVTG